MFIKMKETYSGPAGEFLKGCQYDLPASTVEQLRGTTKKSGYRRLYAEVAPTWDRHKDASAAWASELQKTISKLNAERDRLRTTIVAEAEAAIKFGEQAKDAQKRIGPLREKLANLKNKTEKKITELNIARLGLHVDGFEARADEHRTRQEIARTDLQICEHKLAAAQGELAKLVGKKK